MSSGALRSLSGKEDFFQVKKVNLKYFSIPRRNGGNATKKKKERIAADLNQIQNVLSLSNNHIHALFLIRDGSIRDSSGFFGKKNKRLW